MKITHKIICLAVLSSLFGTGCTDDPDANRQLVGAGTGAAVGGLIGHAVSDGGGGAIIGATAGALAGSYIAGQENKRRRDRSYYNQHRDDCIVKHDSRGRPIYYCR
jgi:uncharacterized protein YcfJ